VGFTLLTLHCPIANLLYISKIAIAFVKRWSYFTVCRKENYLSFILVSSDKHESFTESETSKFEIKEKFGVIIIYVRMVDEISKLGSCGLGKDV